jgi:hypothetical protein
MSNSVAQTVDSLPRSVSSGTEADMAEQPATVANVIEIRVEEISQLFNTLDPFPFREKDLDKDAEELIVGWARELPVDQPLRIAVEALELGEALTRYFGYRARIVTLDLNELFRVGRRALAIGLTVLYFSVVTSQAVAADLTPLPVGSVIEESLIIFGWVANWRSIEIFLCDWWPLVRRRRLYRRLSAAQVDLKPYKNEPKGCARKMKSRGSNGIFA